jgi:hypothetical protein
MQGENRQKSGAYLFVCEHFLVIFNAAVGVSDDAITEFLCRVEVKLGAVDNTRLASRLESHVYTHFAVLSGSIIYENAINCKKMYRCFGS